jgi:hypothetical protein
MSKKLSDALRPGERAALLDALVGVEQAETDEKDEKTTQAEILIRLAGDAELFHTSDSDCYATIPTEKHHETWALKSKSFRRWLLRRFYEAQKKPPGAQAMQDALGVLEAKAHFDGPELPVFTRLAESGGRIYIDLCSVAWEAVEISPDGWRVVTECPVKFRRAKGMLQLPRPGGGGNINDLRRFVNIGNDVDWCLLVSWLMAALRPRGPYPVLVLQGEQGSAKSTNAKVLRALVDPSTAPLRTTPREERDLAIAANNSWVLVFDNLSGVATWLSDALCRVATGGGFATRTLYSDDEETLFDYMRPIIINGIDEIVTRHDLLDRSLIIALPVIPEARRLDENKFWKAFEEARPQIFGALLDTVSAGLRNIDTVKLDSLPRMADFGKWVTACEEALPWETGEFMAAYAGNRAEAVELALEADAVAVAVRSLLTQSRAWDGTVTELLAALENHVPEQTRKSKPWPKTVRAMGRRLRLCATFLRQAGVGIEFVREAGSGRRFIRMGTLSNVTDVTDVTGSQGTLTQQGLEAVTLNETVTLMTSQENLMSQLEPFKHGHCDDSDVCDIKKHTHSNKAPRGGEPEVLLDIDDANDAILGNLQKGDDQPPSVTLERWNRTGSDDQEGLFEHDADDLPF